jgi:ribonuclease HI
VTIYTDGACSGNPGPGGWGAVLIYDDHEESISGQESSTTNNRMELMAAIESLRCLREGSVVTLYTDSQYVMLGITQWMVGWKRKGWKTSGGSCVKNADLWQILDELNAKHEISWRWVKGHAGLPGNERADALAREALSR